MRLQERKYPRMHTVIYAVRVLVPKSYVIEHFFYCFFSVTGATRRE